MEPSIYARAMAYAANQASPEHKIPVKSDSYPCVNSSWCGGWVPAHIQGSVGRCAPCFRDLLASIPG